MGAISALAHKSLYEVHLPQFDGPLDLLLHLVDDEKLLINEVSLASVATQYQVYLKQLAHLDVEIESSYIVVFAQLLELKSKQLLPPDPSPLDEWVDDFGGPDPLSDHGDGGEGGPHELVDQLQAYKMVKEAAEWLNGRETRSMAHYVRTPTVSEYDCLELDVSVDALAAAWVRMDRRYQAPRRAVELQRVVLSVPDRVKQLWEAIRRNPKAFFHQMLNGDYARAYVIVTFLAVLELVRRSRVRAEQNGISEDISITPCADTQTDAPVVAEEYR